MSAQKNHVTVGIFLMAQRLKKIENMSSRQHTRLEIKIFIKFILSLCLHLLSYIPIQKVKGFLYLSLIKKAGDSFCKSL